MKLIDRYIGRQILFTALFAVGVLSFVLVLGNIFLKLFDVLFNHNVPLEVILSVIAYILPFSLTFTIPWGFLTGVILVFGKLSGENELIALKASGVSIPRLCAPLLVLSVIFVAICLWINVDVAPRAQKTMKNQILDIARNNPLSLFDSDHVIDEFPGRKIYIEKKEGTALKNILVYELDLLSNPVRVLFARKGELTPDLENKQLLLHIYDARFEQRDAAAPWDLKKIRQGFTAQQTVFQISLKELYEKNKLQKNFPTMTLNELLNQPDVKNMPPAQANITRATIRTEVNKRFSFSLAAFALALMGVPLAITAHRKETSIGFLFSIIVAFGYYFFLILASMAQNKPQLHPEILVWLPNVVFIAFGSFLFWKLSRK